MRALLVLALLVIARSGFAGVVADNAIEPYPIVGSTAADLRSQMSALGPAGTGGRYDGYTAWQIQWRYDYRASGNACAIAAATVSVRTSIKLPEWRNESTAPAELRARWRRYLQALTEHENGHRDNGLAAAREIDRGLVALPAQANCDAMGAAANAFGQGILRKYNQRDLDYDSATRHGRTQGVNWP